MSAAFLLVVVFSAVALGLSAFALYVSLGARRTAREAHAGVRSLASAAAKRRREQATDPTPVDEREVDLGAPEDTPERRQEDLGPRARHRAPETGRYSRLRASADARDEEPATTSIAAAGRYREEEPDGGLPTVEHPAPDDRFRRPPPPLPPPGAIGRGRP